MKIYTTPKITAPAWQFDAAEQAHILIGGTTGSGKSVALAGLIKSLLRFTPDEVQLLLIDPKGVELTDYEPLPHSLGRFCDPDEIARVIDYTVTVMETRFREMRTRREKKYSGSAIYVIIDEYVDIRLNCPKKTRQDIVKIACKGRAAGIHLVICTQRPTREIIDGALRACLPCVLALRCSSAQESRNLLDRKGAEDLPLFGYGLYMTPSAREIQRVPIPFVSDEEVASLVNHWKNQVETAFCDGYNEKGKGEKAMKTNYTEIMRKHPERCLYDADNGRDYVATRRGREQIYFDVLIEDEEEAGGYYVEMEDVALTNMEIKKLGGNPYTMWDSFAAE